MATQESSARAWRSKARLRGPLAVLLLVGFQLWPALGIFNVLLGGSQGPVEDGNFFLVSHRTLSRVPERLWHWMGFVEPVSVGGLILAAVSLPVMILAHSKRWAWYLRQKDYTVPVTVGCIVSMAWHAAAVFFQGYGYL